MPHLQEPPRLGNQYDDDSALRSYLRRALPPEVLAAIESELREMGALSGGRLYELQLADRLNEPRLTQWSPWGERIDHIELTPLWREAERLAAAHGVIAAAYERKHGRHSRIHQFALAYLFTPSTDIYACPLAMTDGAARTLLDSGNGPLLERALPHLISRDPSRFWTSGQWMTETIGGSDVGSTETVARQGADGTWRLYGTKWFTSAATSQIALTLARPEASSAAQDAAGQPRPPGGKGLALFYLETRNDEGRLRHIRVRRLKDKLGTRKLPTAELDLEGVPAVPVFGLSDGVRNITPMLNITRTWNAISAIALMRRGIVLARDYARRRIAFGRRLSEHPLHMDTLVGLDAEFTGALHLSFRVVELIGRLEAGELDEAGRRLLRILTPIAKLTTAKQAVAVVSECIEAFGGAGYVEDTGLPALLRDTHVLPIWEGTTNVLSLETLRALGGDAGLEVLRHEIERCAREVQHPELLTAVETARAALTHALAWLADVRSDDDDPQAALEAGARRFALTLGRSLQVLLLASHAQWALDTEGDHGPATAARRLAGTRIDHLGAGSPGAVRGS
jgi:acyl-CoA dehydrogenase